MTSLLAVDVGNSHTKLGWFQDGKLRGETRFPTRGLVAQISNLRHAVAEFTRGHGARPAAAVMCSVVPRATAGWRRALADVCGAKPLVVSGDSDIGIANHYADPASLGPDRLVAALAARELYGAPVIVVSLGTATVVDAVSRAGEFLGGAIAPGIEISLGALAQRAARLPPVAFEVASRAIATDTRAGMIAGAFFGAVGQVRELLARQRAEMKQDVPAVITGGWGELLAPHLANIAAVEPALTLVGLRLAWEYRAIKGM